MLKCLVKSPHLYAFDFGEGLMCSMSRGLSYKIIKKTIYQITKSGAIPLFPQTIPKPATIKSNPFSYTMYLDASSNVRPSAILLGTAGKSHLRYA